MHLSRSNFLGIRPEKEPDKARKSPPKIARPDQISQCQIVFKKARKRPDFEKRPDQNFRGQRTSKKARFVKSGLEKGQFATLE